MATPHVIGAQRDAALPDMMAYDRYVPPTEACGVQGGGPGLLAINELASGRGAYRRPALQGADGDEHTPQW